MDHPGPHLCLPPVTVAKWVVLAFPRKPGMTLANASTVLETYKHRHCVSDFSFNRTPRPSVHEGVLAESTSGPQRLEREVDKSVIPLRIGMCPRRLANRGPDA